MGQIGVEVIYLDDGLCIDHLPLTAASLKMVLHGLKLHLNLLIPPRIISVPIGSNSPSLEQQFQDYKPAVIVVSLDIPKRQSVDHVGGLFQNYRF